jgi:hypothetical protein
MSTFVDCNSGYRFELDSLCKNTGENLDCQNMVTVRTSEMRRQGVVTPFKRADKHYIKNVVSHFNSRRNTQVENNTVHCSTIREKSQTLGM